ncbi:wobble nucleotide-excising tRNase [Pedobacter sp. UYP30]|uniref:AAA family ATPase n=1 Tax=Pedobacter sp. UYP30 TaxID=1756400 RepID=UPI00339579E5
MITKIDISKFGLYDNYIWNTEIGNSETFRRLNIIYGRNYSGKTTLSRIFKCLEDSAIHKNYLTCGFTINFSDGSTSSNLQLLNNFKIRVYNSDFVKTNLSWLYNDDGTINPFTILGAKNVELDKQVKDIDLALGNIIDRVGMLFDYDEKEKVFNNEKDAHKSIHDALEYKLRKKANDKIKVDTNLFIPTSSKKTYTISDIKGDILRIEQNISKHLLASEAGAEKKRFLKEVPMPNIILLTGSKPNFAIYYKQAKDILLKKIKPNEPINDLLNDSLLQEWVRQGIDKHKGKRTKCGFCGNPLSKDLWDKLSSHFSKESEDLRSEIETQIENLLKAQENLSGFIKLSKDLFYPSLRFKFDESFETWNALIKAYGNNLNEIIKELKNREKNIFIEKTLSDIPDISELILECLKHFNTLITEHNKKTETLSDDQQKERLILREADVAEFMIDIDYKSEIVNILAAEIKYKKTEAELFGVGTEIGKLSEEKRTLEAQAMDESKGAELVNQHLTHFFGHNELKLIAEGETPNMKFKIQRDGDDASNLSEGESSLISFCYFVARMEDELKGNDSKKLLIYIDDPISSLDSNHIFFMFSLIESIIALPKKYGQLFISTHNLDFLKYLKRLTTPKYKPQPNGKDKADMKHFIIDRKSKGKTSLKLAPDYLKNYITEFNYLFRQIFICSTSDNSTISHEYQYNFGNNMRKFLEAYLFYKYPSHKLTNDQKIQKFLNNDTVSINLVNRVINEYSHIGEQFDRGMQPVDVDEISKISSVIISKIKERDPDQYSALVESIDEEANA